MVSRAVTMERVGKGGRGSGWTYRRVNTSKFESVTRVASHTPYGECAIDTYCSSLFVAWLARSHALLSFLWSSLSQCLVASSLSPVTSWEWCARIWVCYARAVRASNETGGESSTCGNMIFFFISIRTNQYPRCMHVKRNLGELYERFFMKNSSINTVSFCREKIFALFRR
jgi:hypothetical protein